MRYTEVLRSLGIKEINPCAYIGEHSLSNESKKISISSPIDGAFLAEVEIINQEAYDEVITKAEAAFKIWRQIPAPQRGEVVRQIGEALRENKEKLGQLVTIEMGKSIQEGWGEVQEMIDICDFATGLSRQLHGFTMHSERPEHRMYEQYHPLGITGIISAFNFPVAVWSWNAMLAAACGNVCVWKPSEKTPLTAIACHHIAVKVLQQNQLPTEIFSLVIGEADAGKWMAEDSRIPLVSATGSTRMGKSVAASVAKRLGKSILELGGNNAAIITPHANLELALRAVLFGAVGTCGQRCTSTRRLIVHEDMYDIVKESLVNMYGKLTIGNPLDQDKLVGPLIDIAAKEQFLKAIENAVVEGGTILYGGTSLETGEGGAYVVPTLIEAQPHYEMVQEETFAPILYLLKYTGEVENAIEIQNGVKQGLSSTIFSNHLQESERFLSYSGSDCGIANVNIGTSGAEIGGAFGGEKETGGGRESGSDAWKAYMRRQTNTINYSKELPLAQGIKFDL